ncbi:MAG: hypothetical protein ABIE70_10580 [bacterium]
MTHYGHTQNAWWVLMLVVLVSVLVIVLVADDPSAPPEAALLALLPLFVGVQFYRLNVVVDDYHLRIAYGIGLIRVAWPLAEIKACRQVRNQFWYGWGIRWYPGGLLFNVTGLDAVEIILSSGKKRRIGTDDPAALQATLTAILNQSQRRGIPDSASNQ